MFFSLKLTADAPENGWLADDRFLLGPGLLAMSFETRGFTVSVEVPDLGLQIFKVSFSSQRVDVVFCPPPPHQKISETCLFFFSFLQVFSEEFWQSRCMKKATTRAGVIKLPILGGIKQCKYRVILRDFPYNSALFGLIR